MQIGHLSRATGASAKALRHYESLGLLGAVARRGRYRIYSDTQLDRVQMIRLAQGFGFRLAELDWVERADWQEVLRRLHAKRERTQAEIARLQAELARIDAGIAELIACPEAVTHPASVAACVKA
ncbi:MerR family transcriptional regulator [Aquimonas sp.]|jgi:MerR family copper efflux transcriptional regulator|uniref:MerR family transcriptional regulator n=1 Tax=Aquimonas sp. TaxID=1872588 RepID=UPI0037BFE851